MPGTLGIKELSDTDVRLATGPETDDLNAATSPDTEIVYITYYCGKNPPYTLLGKKSDYYYVDLVFTLGPVTPP